MGKQLNVRISDAQDASWRAAASKQGIDFGDWVRDACDGAARYAALPVKDLHQDVPADALPIPPVKPVKDVPKDIYDAVAAHMLGRDQKAINIAAKRTAAEIKPGEKVEDAIARLKWMTTPQVEEIMIERWLRAEAVITGEKLKGLKAGYR